MVRQQSKKFSINGRRSYGRNVRRKNVRILTPVWPCLQWHLRLEEFVLKNRNITTSRKIVVRFVSLFDRPLLSTHFAAIIHAENEKDENSLAFGPSITLRKNFLMVKITFMSDCQL
uniref:Uncharacterized protein n=1 Tax=Romanomermis culicivorax TaxID=13658 RepID=A0A915K5R9_ROMCU